jgi:predicted acetyltransferase
VATSATTWCHRTRRRGHATALLAASLPIAATLEIDCLRLTCDTNNIASCKVIEANGGLFHHQRDHTLRYWVPTG